MENRVKFKIGEIEFEAEGSADLIERERKVFLETLLPAAVDAIVRTRGAEDATQYTSVAQESMQMLIEEGTINAIADNTPMPVRSDFSRKSLASFLTNYGKVSEQDFVLIAAYFEDKKNNALNFSSESVKKCYAETRRAVPSNVSMTINRLVKKGLIMDVPNAEQKTLKLYTLTDDGLKYVEKYKPIEATAEKKPIKSRKQQSTAKSSFADINIDELNLSNYPEVKLFKDFKDKMLMILYIITHEKKGESFAVTDVLCLMTDIFGEAATVGQVNGVYRHYKLWFKSENAEGNNKDKKRKLLKSGVDYIKKLMAETKQEP